jgi:hypothetical protein
MLHQPAHVLGSPRPLDTGKLIGKPPKAAVGIRTVAIPPANLGTVCEYLDLRSSLAADGLLFTGLRSGALRRSNSRRAVGWAKAVAGDQRTGLLFVIFAVRATRSRPLAAPVCGTRWTARVTTGSAPR